MQKKVFISIEEVKRKLESYCVYQDRCHKEIERKLNEYNLIPEVKAEVIMHLMEHNFLDEERFAKSFARGKFRIKKWGRLRIIRELKIRDLSSYNINIALLEIDQADYIATLYALTEQKNAQIKEITSFKRKKKLFDYLNYRGYEIELIYQVIKDVME